MTEPREEEEFLGGIRVPGEGVPMNLLKKGSEFILMVGDTELMTSRAHESEDALAHLVTSRLASLERPVVLIGGLGMGFTLAAALREVGPQARIVVAELVPAVVEWNRGLLAHLAGSPLMDPRVTVHVGDVAFALQTEAGSFDAILLDVDNGPHGLTRDSNDWLYTEDGLAAAYSALRPGGILAVWSAGPDKGFAMRLQKIGFTVEEVRVPTGTQQPGEVNTIWLATRNGS